MRVLIARAQAMSKRAVQAACERIALQLEGEVHGIRVAVGAAQVSITGRKLRRRWLDEAALRFLGASR